MRKSAPTNTGAASQGTPNRKEQRMGKTYKTKAAVVKSNAANRAKKIKAARPAKKQDKHGTFKGLDGGKKR